MGNWMTRLTLNQRLAVVALALGALALFASPYPGGKVTLDAKELALVVGTEADHVEAPELAAWIIEGRGDFRLIDLRSEAEFNEYRIPTAASVPMSVLTEAGLGRNEKLVLYSQGGVHAAQAWMLLRALGYTRAYVLKGGLDEWKDQVVFPVLADTPTPEQRARDERARAMSAFFGGQPRSAAAASAGVGPGAGLVFQTMPALPKVVAPPTPAAGKAAAPKKKKEGC